MNKSVLGIAIGAAMTLGLSSQASASLLISGTGIFNHPDGIITGIAALREAIGDTEA